jgi:hypothetical protein
MKVRDFKTTAIELLEDTLVDRDLRYELACFIEENPRFRPRDPKIIADVTGSFNSLLRECGLKKKGSMKVGAIEGKYASKFLHNAGHHSIIFTENLAAARTLARGLAIAHTKGHLVYDASKENERWLRRNIKRELRTKSIAIIPREGVMTDGDDFMARSGDVLDLLASYIDENKKVHKTVTGVSLTTTETLMALTSRYWQPFVEDYESEATSRLRKLSSNWICVFSFSELNELDYLRKFPNLLVDVIRAHDTFLVQDRSGEIISGEKAVIVCFRKFLESIRLRE